MTYTITSAKQLEDSILTEVEYTFGEDKMQASITHFQPESVDEINQAIVNRAVSEQQKLEAIKICEGLVGEIEIGKEVEI